MISDAISSAMQKSTEPVMVVNGGAEVRRDPDSWSFDILHRSLPPTFIYIVASPHSEYCLRPEARSVYLA
jgi:hypothetical protein